MGQAVVRVALWLLVKLFRLSARGFDALATRTETLREWLTPDPAPRECGSCGYAPCLCDQQ